MSDIHVFVDANILLGFFEYSKDDLNTLRDVFASQEHGLVTIYLTEQVHDEFRRNREKRIKHAMAQFGNANFQVAFPHFVREYSAATELRDLLGQCNDAHTDIVKHIEADAKNGQLAADQLLADILENQTMITRDDDIVQRARTRVDIGNPPGKKGTMGDAINWISLLTNVPSGNDIHIVSGDGDFFSELDKSMPNMFLQSEWQKEKEAELRVYRYLRDFINNNFPEQGSSFDSGEKDDLIEQLMHSGSFKMTHTIIAELGRYSYYSLDDVRRLLDVVVDNNQVGWIVEDDDVAAFFRRISDRHVSAIKDPEHRDILDKVRQPRDGGQ